jgi:hypothetical protein
LSDRGENGISLLGITGYVITEVRWIVRWSGCDKFLKYFKVPQTGIETKRSKLVMKTFDEYTNILKGMYSTRFNDRPTGSDTCILYHSVPHGPIPSLISDVQVWQSNKIRSLKEKEKKERE